MLSQESIASIERYWAADLDCTVEELRGEQIAVTRQGGPSVFIFARQGSVVVVPPLIRSERIIGPAFIGYADAGTYVSCDHGQARLLDESDRDAIAALRSSCGAVEWEHGGATNATTCVGVFRETGLASLASYEIWGERIAHIAIIAHPSYRGQGLARSAVSAITKVALDYELVAQYRTLVSNQPSMAIARRLGFQGYALSLAIRM
jgi:hypothetical protein